MRRASSARRSAASFFESSRPTMRRLGLRMTAAATTGPKSAPRPASSMPAMRVQPSLRAARSKREEQRRDIFPPGILSRGKGERRDSLRKNQGGGGRAWGHSKAKIFPSGARSRAGAYKPRYSRRHQRPVERFVARSVNQYCQTTARTWRGGDCGNGLLAKRERTSLSSARRSCSVRTTKGFSRQKPREANQRFQSKRG